MFVRKFLIFKHDLFMLNSFWLNVREFCMYIPHRLNYYFYTSHYVQVRSLTRGFADTKTIQTTRHTQDNYCRFPRNYITLVSRLRPAQPKKVT